MNTLGPNVSLVSFETWLAAIASSACIGFTSLVPWLFNLTFFEKQRSTAQQDGQNGGDDRMKYLLSFAIGAILGDIFFHLIPESIDSHQTELGNSLEVAERNVGISIIAGIFLFIIVEMVLQKWSGQETAEQDLPDDAHNSHSNTTNASIYKEDDQDLKQNLPDVMGKTASILDELAYEANNNNNYVTPTIVANSNEYLCHHQTALESATDTSDHMNNNYLASSPDQNLVKRKSRDSKSTTSNDVDNKSLTSNPDDTAKISSNLTIDPAGYLNLIANGFDNFTHGLAIGASFLVGMKVGILTTFVIFIHEIPHEICDYAILVKSGFSRWEAVKAQSSVSLFGMMGTALALYVKSVDKLNAKTVWILPFSAGGFLYIALVTLLPDILDKQTNFRSSVGQIASVILGITFMGLIALL